jgi:hypothetical protein
MENNEHKTDNLPLSRVQTQELLSQPDIHKALDRQRAHQLKTKLKKLIV